MEKVKITGQVVGGNRIGRTLGFPTANIVIGDDIQAMDGVYAARTEIDGIVYRGMANVGYKPTVSTVEGDVIVTAGSEIGQISDRLLEINLFGFDGDLYGQTISVELLKFIRPEISFSSLDELKAMVDKDRKQIEEYFKTVSESV